MSQTPQESAHPRFAKPQRVAFVQSAWHRDVVAACREAFLAEIEARHIALAQIDVFEVPGSFEIPLHVQLLAKTRRFTAIVAAGLVVDDEYIAETVIRALMEVQLRTEIPVFSAVVTPSSFTRPLMKISCGAISRPRARRSQRPAPIRCSAWSGCAGRWRPGSCSETGFPLAAKRRNGAVPAAAPRLILTP